MVPAPDFIRMKRMKERDPWPFCLKLFSMGTSIGTSKSPFFADLHFADVLKQEEPWA